MMRYVMYCLFKLGLLHLICLLNRMERQFTNVFMICGFSEQVDLFLAA